MSNTRSTRNQPFCWQEKKILRLLRKHFEGSELQKLRNLYLSITEMDSDFNGENIKFYTKTVSTYSGLSKDWIPKGLKIFEDLKMIEIIEDRENGKFKGKRLVFTPENIEEIPVKTAPGKPSNGKSINGNLESSEDSISLEDNSLKEDNKIKKDEIIETINFLMISNDLKNSLKEFNEHRKTLKKPLTKLALTKLMNRLGTEFKSEQELIHSIDKSIENGYTGVFVIKDNFNNNKKETIKTEVKPKIQEYSKGVNGGFEL